MPVSTLEEQELDLETAFELPISNVYEGVGFTIELEGDENWPNIPYTFSVARSAGGPAIITITSGNTPGNDSSITITGVMLRIFCPDTINILKGGKTYFYELMSHPLDTLSRVEGNGPLSVKFSIKK